MGARSIIVFIAQTDSRAVHIDTTTWLVTSVVDNRSCADASESPAGGHVL